MEQIIEYSSKGFEVVGSLIVIFGGVKGFWYLLRSIFNGGKENWHEKTRSVMGKKMILGLDFFLAGDVLHSVNSPNWNSLGMLGALVAIRTIMTYFILKEIHEHQQKPLKVKA